MKAKLQLKANTIKILKINCIRVCLMGLSLCYGNTTKMGMSINRYVNKTKIFFV